MKKKYKIIMSLTLSVVVSIIFTGCLKLYRIFYVDELDVFISIEEIYDGRYRIGIYKNQGQINDDYIDVSYKMSEMPSITMNFPLDESNNINIINRYDIVESYKSTNLKIIYPEVDRNKLDEIIAYNVWCDSVKSITPSISITLDGYLDNLIIWNGNGKLIRRISPLNQ